MKIELGGIYYRSEASFMLLFLNQWGKCFGTHWIEDCAKLRKRLDALVKRIIAGLSQIKRQLSGSQPNDYSGYIHVIRHSQKNELTKQKR
jgi:hypothetical protein